MTLPGGVPRQPAAHAWQVPEPSAVIEVRPADGAVIRRHGNPDGPRVLLSHGNGLAADAYYPFWSHLTERFDLFVYDLRNHGWNPVGDRRRHHMPSLVEDCGAVLGAIARTFGPKPIAGIFHSTAAIAALLHAQGWPAGRSEPGFSALIVFDVPLRVPRLRVERMYRVSDFAAAAARTRQYQFTSMEAFVRYCAGLVVYARVVPGALELLARATLRPAADGAGYELRCPREYEAQLVAFQYGWALQVELGQVQCPLKAVGADPTEQYSFLPSVDLSTLTDLDYDFLPGTTHLLQLEQPYKCARLVIEFLERAGHA